MTTSWNLADTPMYRVNPTPGLRLGGDRLGTVLRALFTAHRDCRSLADEVCEELYRLAGVAVGRERHRLLRLKRAVFNDRSPDAADLRDGWQTPLPLGRHRLAGRQRTRPTRPYRTGGGSAGLPRRGA